MDYTCCMAKDKEYEILFQQYQRAIAKAKDLQEQLDTKNDQWQQRNGDFDIIEKNVRELCEDILAKDNKEMVLGRDYSWATTPVNELILKARKVFKEYNASRTDLMRKIMDTSEDRRDQIESLKEQIIFMKTQGVQSGQSELSEDELQEQIDKELEEKKKQEQVIKDSKSMSPAVQQAIKSGNLDVSTFHEAMSEGGIYVVEEDFDLDDDEIVDGQVVRISKEKKLRKEAVEDASKMKLTKKSIPITKSKKAINDKKELKKKLDKEYTMNILSDLEKKISEHGWVIIDVIAKYGHSKANVIIEQALLEAEKSGLKTSKSRMRTNLTDLSNIGILKKEPVHSPYTKFFAYSLTTEGARIFKAKYNEEPILSEMDRIIAEHDNVEHGYGIKEVSERIVQSECFETVEIWNRKNNVITISGNITYIPDIVCTSKNGEHTYIEYELNNYGQRQFNIKCNKINACTNTINFIVPDRVKAEQIMEKLVKWAETKPKDGKMRHVIVRVTTAGALNGEIDLTLHESWMYTYRPAKDKEPKNNF